MSEEEWIAKKREIKYIRERLRRAKRANEHRAAADAEKKLKAAIAATMERNDSEPVSVVFVLEWQPWPLNILDSRFSLSSP